MKVSEIKSMLDRYAGSDIKYLLIDDSEQGSRTLVILPKDA